MAAGGTPDLRRRRYGISRRLARATTLRATSRIRLVAALLGALLATVSIGVMPEPAHAAAAPAGLRLVVSMSADRAAPQPLEAATVSGPVYVFTTPDTDVTRVRFWVDTSTSTAPYRTENFAPMDLAGGTAATANPFDTATLTAGPHTITAIATTAEGDVALRATFGVVPPVPGLRLSKSGVAFNGKVGSGVPATTLRVSTVSAPAPVAVTATSSVPWLQATLTPIPTSSSSSTTTTTGTSPATPTPVTTTPGTPAAGVLTPATLTLTPRTAGLRAGGYRGEVRVEATGLAPVVVPVSLDLVCTSLACAAPGLDLLANGGFEAASAAAADAPAGWSPGRSGDLDATFAWTDAGDGTAHSGRRSARVQITRRTSGSAAWVSDGVAAGPKQILQVGTWYRADAPVGFGVEVWNANWSFYRYLWLGQLPASHDWRRASFAVTTPPGTQFIRPTIELAGVGTLDIDDVSAQVPVPLVRPLVSVTFDDGNDSICTRAIPALNARGLVSTQYVTTGVLDQPGFCTSAQIAAAGAAGHEIGSHTVTHPHLPSLAATGLASELDASKATLEALTGRPVTSFADPYGETDATVTAAVRARYASQRTTDSGLNLATSWTPENLVIREVDAGITTTQVKAWVDEAVRAGAWLILLYHGVSPTPGPYDVTPANLNAQLDYLVTTHVAVRSVDDARREVAAQSAPA